MNREFNNRDLIYYTLKEVHGIIYVFFSFFFKGWTRVTVENQKTKTSHSSFRRGRVACVHFLFGVFFAEKEIEILQPPPLFYPYKNKEEATAAT